MEEVQNRGLQLQSIQVRGLSPSGRPMFTDIAHTVFNPQLPTLIHLSGCHGIEGYLGSAIQTEILKTIELTAYQKVNIIFVHVLNPWGMSWYRRVNAHNVDLNRNFFPDGTERPQNLDFDVFAPLFEKRPQQKKWKTWKQIILTIFRKGFRESAGIIARGQYHLEESLFYGGSHLEPEITEPLRVLQKIIKGNSPILCLDVHSGLGKFGSENWLLDGNHNDDELQLWNKFLEQDLVDVRTAKGFYPAQGMLSVAFRNTFAANKVSYIYEEFGTRPLLAIFRGLIREHKSFLKLKLDRARAFLMIAAFYPYEKGWRVKTLDCGKESYFRVLRALNDLK